MIGRGLRLMLAGALSVTGTVALAGVPGGRSLSAEVVTATDSPITQTSLEAHTRIASRNGSNLTQGVFSVSVTGEDGKAAAGTVTLEDGGKPLAAAVLNASGQAEITLDMAAGTHTLRAVYSGDVAHAGSSSATAQVTADATGTPDFQVAVNPAAMTLTAGQNGNVVVSLTPVDASALTGPMFVTLSCSGFPDQSSCTFTPQNVQILPNTTAAVTSDMVIATQTTGTRGASAKRSNGMALAILLPGAAGLMGLAFGARKRGWARLMLIALVGMGTSLGMSACSPLYDFYNHGPNVNLPTPAGTFQMLVTAQSSNGVTAITHPTQFVLTVNPASN
ncbi:Ig-like domain-containing protein [Terracidiphilus sp.]|uniref:Ig-like domain-containing protein n=1 Tax=Terracidiphilus sp. TaxID=1964191 RepID=UPI003C23A733